MKIQKIDWSKESTTMTTVVNALNALIDAQEAQEDEIKFLKVRVWELSRKDKPSEYCSCSKPREVDGVCRECDLPIKPTEYCSCSAVKVRTFKNGNCYWCNKPLKPSQGKVTELEKQNALVDKLNKEMEKNGELMEHKAERIRELLLDKTHLSGKKVVVLADQILKLFEGEHHE